MKKINRASLWYPTYIAGSILEIDPATLRHDGITHIVFDLDRTLVRRRTNELSSEYAVFMKSLQQAGFTILIGSNTRRDITTLRRKLAVTAVHPRGLSYKPFVSFYRRVAAAAGTTPDHLAMVGDHILNDAIGGNRAGFTTILVEALHHEQSTLYRWYFRRARRIANDNG